MRKALKIGAILLGVVVALFVILVIVATVVIDPNRYRDDIIKTVKAQTGRDLKIEGDLELSFFPWIGLETGRLILSNAPGFGPEPFARVESAAIKVELLPLLRKQVIVDAVRLLGLRLNLARAKDGRTNWEDMLQAKGEPKPAPQQQPPPKAPDASAGLALFTVNRVEVRDSEFTWRDMAAGTSYALRRVELTSGNVLGDSPAPLRLAFDLESGKPKISRRIELDARLNADLDAQMLHVPDLRLNAGDLKVQAELHGNNILDAPRFSGRLEIPPFNLRALLQELQIPYTAADPNALTKVGLTSKLDYGPKAIGVPDLRLTLDQTALTGKVNIKHEPRTSYGFDLAVDNIDVDRYLPPATDNDKAADKKAGAEAVVVPLALLRDTDAEGQLRVQKLKAFGIHSEQVVVKVAAHKGRIVLGPNEARLYGGVYAGRTVLDASVATPRFQFEEKLTGVQLGPLLEDADVFDRYSGTGNIDLKLTAQGLDATQIKRTLNGTAAVDLRDGKIEGVNLQKIVVQARSLYDKARGQEVQAAPQTGDETAFSALTATARLTNGVARNDDLKLVGPVVRATGAGTADLVKETLDYRLQVTLAEGTERAGTTIPVRITGTFAQPSYRVELGALLKEQTKPLEQKLEKRLEKKFDEQLDRLRQRLKR